MFKRALKIAIIFCGLAGSLILVEVIYFHLILFKSEALEKSDLIVVFAGVEERVKAGYDLARLGYAPYLVISPADTKKLKTYNEKNGLSKDVKHLVEDKARTTVENAVYTSRIILARQFDSVILVTSFWHMPRSYFLLRSLLAGSNVRVQTYVTEAGKLNRSNLLKPAVVKWHIWNEMVKFWTSNVELLSYKIRGSLPGQNPKDSPAVKYLKSLFLFHE